MPKPRADCTYDDIKRVALALPGVLESTSYGTPALKVRTKLMVRLKEDQQTLVIACTWEERERLMLFYPQAFHVTDHYRPYDWVLADLTKVDPELMPSVLQAAWQLRAPASLVRQYGKNAT